MLTKFYDYTITTKFIKELVAKTEVPFISTWKPGDFAVRGMFYLSNDTIWKCEHTGWPKTLNDTCGEDHASTTAAKNRGIDEGPKFFKRISPYVFGREYKNITGHHKSNISGYDPKTHFYLGLYLRFMRDVYNLDLMPFYNCYSGEDLVGINFKEDGLIENYYNNSSYKILQVPVRFDKTYMISIDSDTSVEVMCAIVGPEGVLKEHTQVLNKLNVKGISNQGTTYKKYNKMCFLKPLLYKTVSWHQLNANLDPNSEFAVNELTLDQRFGLFEKYLRLLIKIPKNNKSSLVVIEGDYSLNLNNDVDYKFNNQPGVTWINKTFNQDTVNSKLVTGDWFLTNKEYIPIKKLNLSPLSLLQVNDGNTYAFSDRLIEYLTQNAINHLDTFSKDIERIQNYSKSDINNLKNGSIYEGNFVKGVWDKGLQEYLFELVKDTDILDRKLDLNGYVDKDTELVISRGLSE